MSDAEPDRKAPYRGVWQTALVVLAMAAFGALLALLLTAVR